MSRVSQERRLHARETLIGGVRVGAISYCFRSIPRPAAGDYMDTLIDAFRKTGLATCELESVRVEPEPAIAGGGRVPATITPEYTKRREELRQWRLTTPLARFTEIRGKFQQAGIDIFGYVVTFSDDFTDAEIDRSFQFARTLGAGVIGTNQTRVPMGPRLAPFAEKYGIALGWHNHANVTDPTEVASVESFERLFAMSKQFKANLDIGHFVARQQRSRGVHPQVPRSYFPPAPEGPPAQQRPQHAVGTGRDSRCRRPATCSRRRSTRSSR